MAISSEDLDFVVRFWEVLKVIRTRGMYLNECFGDVELRSGGIEKIWYLAHIYNIGNPLLCSNREVIIHSREMELNWEDLN